MITCLVSERVVQPSNPADSVESKIYKNTFYMSEIKEKKPLFNLFGIKNRVESIQIFFMLVNN